MILYPRPIANVIIQGLTEFFQRFFVLLVQSLNGIAYCHQCPTVTKSYVF